MPHLFGLAVLGTALYCAYRALRREMQRIGEELDHDAGKGGDRGRDLVRDPATGVYRPGDRG